MGLGIDVEIVQREVGARGFAPEPKRWMVERPPGVRYPRPAGASLRELLDKIDTRRQLVRETVERLREQITLLTEQPGAAEDTLKRLGVTRETILELAAENGFPPPEPLPPGYHEIQAAFEKADGTLRAKEVCQALAIGTEPRHVEGIRAKLKRLVSRGILVESEPGLFALPLAPRPASCPQT